MDRSMFRDVLHNDFQMTDDIILDRGMYMYEGNHCIILYFYVEI